MSPIGATGRAIRRRAQEAGPSISWETASDWDGAQSESGVHHQQPTGTDWAAADVVEKGYPTSFPTFGANLIRYYPSAEATGSTGFDVASGEDGTYTDTTLAAEAGPFGKNTPSYDGTDDFFDVGSLVQPGTGELAICAWIKTTAQDGDIVDSFNDTNACGLWIDDTTGPSFYTRNGATATMNDFDTFRDGNWHFWYGHQDADNSEVRFAFDGSFQATTAGSGSVDAQDHSHHFMTNGEEGSGPVAGEVCHVMFWDGPLTASELTILHDAAISGSDLWTPKKTGAGEQSTISLTTTTSIPAAGTSITVTLFEDVGNDGAGASTDAIGNSFDNSASTTVSAGEDTNDLTGFDGGGSENGYWAHLEVDGDGADPTLETPTVSSVITG